MRRPDAESAGPVSHNTQHAPTTDTQADRCHVHHSTPHSQHLQPTKAIDNGAPTCASTQAAAVGAILSGWVLSGASLFTLAMCHKHMALYYAPAFFAHLLGRCLQRPTFFAKVGWGCPLSSRFVLDG